MNPLEQKTHTSGTSFLGAARGIKSWLFTLDHKRIGIMYLFFIIPAFILGGLLALILRMSLLKHDGSILTHQTYNEVFTMHGLVMVFLVLLPAVPAILGNFILPIQLGTKDMALPRLNLLSLYVFVIGAVMALIVLFFGRLDTGWTFYTPYSTSKASGYVPLMLVAAFILGMSSILTAINFLVTIHKLRAPGLTFDRLPLFVWSSYATSLIQILATPVVGITLLLVAAEQGLGLGIFDPLKGGDPLLFQHLFWFYSHPAVYVMIVPAFGITSELLATFSRKPVFGYKAIAMSSVGIAILGFFVWGHHMFTTGQSGTASSVFSFLTVLVAVPTAIKIFNWTATLYKGQIHLRTPMIYALGFLFLFGIGGLTGLFLATLSTDLHLHDSYFVVAHFHFVMVGGALFGFFGGLHYWWPKITGKMYNEFWATVSCIVVFICFNATFLPQFVLGIKGMARRYHSYDAPFRPLNVSSTYAAFALGIGFSMMLIVLIYSLFKGQKATDNPFGGTTLEWKTSSPPPVENFIESPVVTGGPYDREVE